MLRVEKNTKQRAVSRVRVNVPVSHTCTLLFVRNNKYFMLARHMHPMNSITVDREIFAVKKFSPVARVAKIKRVKNYFALYLQYKIWPGGEN